MKYIFTVALAVCLYGQGWAEFLPSEYAIYRLTQINSADSNTTDDGTFRSFYVNPYRAAKITEALKLNLYTTPQSNGTNFLDLDNESVWVEGAPWVQPDDSLPRALNCINTDGANGIQSSVSYQFNPKPVFNVIVADIKFPMSTGDKGLRFFSYRYDYHQGTTRIDNNYGGITLTSQGYLEIRRKVGKPIDKTYTDTLRTKFLTDEWIPLIVQFQTVGSVKEMALFLGESEAYRDTIGPNPSQDSLVVSIGGGRDESVHVGSFAHFAGVTGDEVSKGYMQWEEAPGENMCDTVIYPVYVHQILYDPPGDGSYSSISDGQTITNKMAFTIGGEISITMMAGYEREFSKADLLGIGGKTAIDFEFSTTASASYQYGSEWTTTYQSESKRTSQKESFLRTYIGPGGGDMVVYEPFRLERKMFRRPKLGGGFTGDADTAYIYYVFHTPIPDKTSYTRAARMTDLLREMKDDSSAMTILRNESVIDYETGKIRPECISSGRLTRLDENWIYSGNSDFTRTSSEKTGSAVSHQLSIGYSLDMKAKLMLSGFKVGGQLHLKATTGGSTKDGEENTRKVSYTLFDNESWDNFAVRVYLDNRFGTYVFQVDSTQSYSSFPYEGAYTIPGADFSLSADATNKIGAVGETVQYQITVRNNSIKLTEVVTFTSEMINFPHTAKVFPEEAKLAPNESAVFTVSLSAPEAGVFDAPLRVKMTGPAPKRSLEKELALRSVFTDADAGLLLACDNPTHNVSTGSSDVDHTFILNLANLGLEDAVIETGTKEASEGVTYSIGKAPSQLASGTANQIDVSVTGTGDNFPYTLIFWTKQKDVADSYQEITLTINNDSSLSPIDQKQAIAARILDAQYFYGTGLVYTAPGSEPAHVELYTLSGKRVFRQSFSGMGIYSDFGNGTVGQGMYICRIQQAAAMVQKLVWVVR
ncbi:MAG: hypothetical protein HQK83_00960 [Fibrobacteria bacterium]|nr:hypothetical protein [Fibrobacteria bacterium]